ncbi:FecR family protein [Colwelliaceae bacterium 6441]
MSKQTLNNQIKQQANFWVRCLKRGLNDAEKPQLIAWLNQNPKHYQAVYKQASFFDDISELKELNGIFHLEKKSPLKSININHLFFIVVFLSLIALAINMTWSNFSPSSPTINYQTAIGEKRQFLLADGTNVTLNTDSRIIVNYHNNHRKINLLYGEALFDVAKDKRRPFTVTAGAKSFTALGTVFNIQKNNEVDIELIVQEGQVLVSDHHTRKKLAELITDETNKHNSITIITDGEKSVIENKKQQPTQTLTRAQAEQELSWQHGMLIFRGETLSQALKEVSRYTDVQFEITNEEVSDIKIAGYFKAGDIKGLLDSLTHNFDISYKYNATNSIQLSLKNNHS